MARQLRIVGPGLTYHVTARGTGRMAIFLDTVDRRRFLALFSRLVRDFDLQCHAYCLMTNHYHLVITTRRPNISRAIQQLNSIYAGRWNMRHGRVGHLFQGRFGAQIVQDGPYFLTLCRYVVLNPVRAGLVATPEEWPWSSYRATVGLARAPRLLDPSVVLSKFGDAVVDARQYFHEFVRADAADMMQMAGDRILGDDTFARHLASVPHLGGREAPRDERLATHPLAIIFAGVRTRAERTAAIVQAYRHGHAQVAIARFLGVHYTTVSKALKGSELEESDEERCDPA